MVSPASCVHVWRDLSRIDTLLVMASVMGEWLRPDQLQRSTAMRCTVCGVFGLRAMTTVALDAVRELR